MLLYLTFYDMRILSLYTSWKKGPNREKMCNFVQMLIFIWPKSKMRYWCL